jgi:hypothetical protein
MFRKVVKFYISPGHLWEGNNLNFGTLNSAAAEKKTRKINFLLFQAVFESIF